MQWRQHLSFLKLCINVRIAVSISTQMTHVRLKSARAYTPLAALSATERQRGGISLILIINLLLLLLLSLCCGVCKSNELSLTIGSDTISASPLHAVNEIDAGAIRQLNLRPLSGVNKAAIGNNESQVVAIVTRDCLQNCKEEQNIFYNEYGFTCNNNSTDSSCYRTRCSNGCNLWWNALTKLERCQKSCMSMPPYTFDLPCIGACRAAQNHFWHLRLHHILRKLYETPVILARDTTMANLPILQWHIDLPHTFLAQHPFHIQFRYETLNGEGQNYTDNWHQATKYECNERLDCKILQTFIPYSSYTFRFGLRVGDGIDDVFYTTPTKSYKTGAFGTPYSAPVLKNVWAVDDRHVCAFWQPGRYTNGRLTGYEVVIKHDGNSSSMFLPPDVNNYTFSNLRPYTTYTLSVAMVNAVGQGPEAATTVITKKSVEVTDYFNGFNSFIIVGEYSIKIKTLEQLAETVLLFSHEHLISDYAFIVTRQLILVLDTEGNIFRVPIKGKSSSDTLLLEKKVHDFKAAKISVDWLNERLYFAGETLYEKWVIISTNYGGNSMQILANNLKAPIDQLIVDPINGWLFWRQGTELMQMNLANKAITPVKAPSDVTYFVNDFERNLLLVYSDSHNEMYELSYSGTYAQSLYLNSSWVLQSDLLSFWYIGGNILGTNGTHILRQNYYTSEHFMWATNELEWCWNLFPMLQNYKAQPLPVPRGAPSELRAVLGAKEALIKWTPPPRNPFQTDYAWQKWQYELEILDVDSNSAFTIRSITTEYFEVQNLQPHSLYSLRVRASSQGGVAKESEWSEYLLTRTWPLEEQRFLLAGASGVYAVDSLYEARELNPEAQRLGNGFENVHALLELNDTMFYISQRKELRCASIANPEASCEFSASNVVSLTYEWRGGKLYWADSARNCVMRANLDGSERELLPIFDAQQIWADSINGHLYYTTGMRLVRRSLSGSKEAADELFYDVTNTVSMIRGFAVDLIHKNLYWVVRRLDGNVELHQASLKHYVQDAKKMLAQDIQFGSLQYLSAVDSLMWIELNSSRIVMARVETLNEEARIELPHVGKLNSAHLRLAYTPYVDWTVVPAEVDSDSIRLDYIHSDGISIKWDPSSTAENYTVFYKIVVQHGNTKMPSLEVTGPTLRLGTLQNLQQKLNVSITPYTFWSRGETSHASLKLFTNTTLSKPKRLRMFLQHLDTPLQPQQNVSIIVRWDAPYNMHTQVDINYKVYCWKGSELIAQHLHNGSTNGPLETTFYGLHVGESYQFQVEVFFAGHMSVGEKSSLHELHIDPEVLALPRLLFTTHDLISELDLDLNTEMVLVHTASEVDHLVVLQSERRLLWVNENVELLTFVPNSKPVKLVRMRAEVLSLTVDWVQRVVYWAEMSVDRFLPTASIYQLDLCRFEGRVMTPIRLFSFEEGQIIKDLVILPFSRTLLWLQSQSGMLNATLTGFNLSDFTELQFPHTPMVRLYAGSLSADLETVSVIDAAGKTYSIDMQRKMYNLQKIHFAVPLQELEQIDHDAGYIYTLHNETVRAYSKRKQNIEYQSYIKFSTRIRAYNHQEYPPRHCLLPQEAEILRNKTLLNPKVMSYGESSLILEFPVLHTLIGCTVIAPGIKYILQVSNAINNTARNYTTYERQLSLIDLKTYTNYTLQLFISTYYQAKLKMRMMHSDPITVCTAVGTPTAPRNFTGYPLNPTQIFVSWLPPLQLNADQVWYQLHWFHELDAYILVNETSITLTNVAPGKSHKIWVKAFTSSNKFSTSQVITVKTFEEPGELRLVNRTAYNLTLGLDDIDSAKQVLLVYYNLQNSEEYSLNITARTYDFIVPNLMPKTQYEFYIQIFYGHDFDPYTWPERSNGRFIYETLGDAPSQPGRPQIEHITGEIFKVFWEPARNNGAPIIEYSLEALQARSPKRIRRAEPHNSNSSALNTTETLPSANSTEALQADSSTRVKREQPTLNNSAELTQNGTDSGQLSQGLRHKRKRKRRNRAKLPPNDNSERNATKMLQNQMLFAEEALPIEDKWIVYCNTSEQSCIVRDLYSMRLLMFRVRARNAPYGWGPYSEDSVRVSEPFVSPEKRDSLVLAIITPAAVVSSCVVILVILRIVHARRMKAKKMLQKSRPSIWSNISTLQQQQIMAGRHRTFSTTSNSTLYTGGPLSDADIALLPHIHRDQIKLLNFLGSGAFGEVYEGQLNLGTDTEPEKVAIKTLRKGASEFTELLQEAQLMSNFRHENIVRLIGICCDSESVSIIMEHMEGGDLLTYLRESRPNSNTNLAPLQLLDMISMCIDVATGCSYLEDMHFVHRDLACRNCLVSSREPSKRVVKVGDFGLARDIYKSDYYRKEGEGLLPVRWMAPESLVDGLFTTQSDVWAFGVLCWEILTLGQQPYAARNNFEVLTYVKEGGRLEQPNSCPDKLFDLLLQCWSTDPDERPSFRKCLNTLLSIKTDVRRVNLGYSADAEDYATYTNNSGVVLSSFLANPLPKVEEEDDDAQTTNNTMCDNENSKASYDTPATDMDVSTISDDSQWTKSEEPKNSYTNVGVSRL